MVSEEGGDNLILAPDDQAGVEKVLALFCDTAGVEGQSYSPNKCAIIRDPTLNDSSGENLMLKASSLPTPFSRKRLSV
jgi:hypothetical protein